MVMASIKERFKDLGLTDILALDASIKTDIRYATVNNFTGKVLYNEDLGVFCVPELAEAVVNANRMLKKYNNDLSIIIFDAARPLSIQKEMFDLVRGTNQEPYIANPYGKYSGGFHNYGLAVDLSICNSKLELLDMGTGYDAFNELAHTGKEQELLANGKITLEAFNNRELLYSITRQNGLYPHPNEWWHFQLSYEEEVKDRYSLLDF